jgi:hypothetical protein
MHIVSAYELISMGGVHKEMGRLEEDCVPYVKKAELPKQYTISET